MRFAAGLIISVFLFVAPLAAQSLNTKTIDRAVAQAMNAWQIPGLAVAVVQNDRVVYVNGYGTKQLGGTERVTGDTLFQIASTSKAFTTTALAMLIADGKLSWDDPVREHLDYFRLSDTCADSQVTIRDIVSHRTGLRRHDELWDNTPVTREELVRSVGHLALTKPFRTRYQYQNIMFVAAGEVVANAAGVSWDEFVRARIFQPLAMTRTVTSDEEWRDADHAMGHRYDAERDRVVPQRPIDTATIGAAGAIKSSARDMANWIRFHLANGAFNGHQIVDAEVVEETKMPQTVIRMEGSTRDTHPHTTLMSYGMGWVIQDYRGELLVSHAGNLNGFVTHVDLLPKRNSGFVIMANVRRGLAAIALRNTLADILSGKQPRDWNAYYLMIDAKNREKEKDEKEGRVAERRQNTTPSRPLAEYAGEYESRGYGTAKIGLVDDRLVLQWNQLTIPLEHFHYDVFTADSDYDEVEEEVTFALAPDGDVASMEFFGETFERRVD